MTPSFHRLLLLLAGLAAPMAAGCSTIAISFAAGAISGGGGSLASDDDPELVRDSIPFGLKTMESLLDADPENEDLLLALCSGFTQYAYAFVQQEAERLDEKDPPRSRELMARARKLFARARRYGMRGLEELEEGFTAAFEKDRKAAVKMFEDDEDDVPLLYWTAVAWAAQISISKNDAKLLGDLPWAEALVDRAYALAPDWNHGAIHEFYVAYYGGRPASAGGSIERARRHYDRALALTGGKKVGLYVSWAESVTTQQQDKKKFLELLDQALSFNVDEAPQLRLVNLIAQDRARRLKARVEDLFAE